MLVPSLSQLSCSSTMTDSPHCCKCAALSSGGSSAVDAAPGNRLSTPATSPAVCPEHINHCRHQCHTKSYFGTYPLPEVTDHDHCSITDKGTKGPSKSSANEALKWSPKSSHHENHSGPDLHKSPRSSRMRSNSQSCPQLCTPDMALDGLPDDLDGNMSPHPIAMTLSPPPQPSREFHRLLSLDDLSLDVPNSREELSSDLLSPKSLTRDDSHLDLLRDDFETSFCSHASCDRESDCDSHVMSDPDCDNKSVGKCSPRLDGDVSTDTVCAHRQCNCQDIRSGSSKVHKDIAVIPEVVPKFCTRFELEHWYR